MLNRLYSIKRFCLGDIEPCVCYSQMIVHTVTTSPRLLHPDYFTQTSPRNQRSDSHDHTLSTQGKLSEMAKMPLPATAPIPEFLQRCVIQCITPYTSSLSWWYSTLWCLLVPFGASIEVMWASGWSFYAESESSDLAAMFFDFSCT